MVLQRHEIREWLTVIEDFEAVKSPIDIEKFPASKYRLTNPIPWQIEKLWNLTKNRPRQTEI